ncbi:MAG TPA: hypothetical protein VI521_02235 [Candidatus Babeliales bacterium]|nr:hypothetical protein [Candidatus Babeliales bacterium]
MKSIMQEASSISKAIDLAWNRADKPSQFSVKVLEEPEHNMFGLTVKSAKIAIFFEEKRKVESPSRQPERPQRPVRQEQPKHQEQPKYQEQPKRVQEQPQVARVQEAPKVQSEEHPPKRNRPEWTESLVQEAKDWLDKTLHLIDASDATYAFSHSKSAIKIVFDKSVTGNEGKDRMLFSSFASLILSTLRHRHKKQLRNLKVILLVAS